MSRYLGQETAKQCRRQSIQSRGTKVFFIDFSPGKVCRA